MSSPQLATVTPAMDMPLQTNVRSLPIFKQNIQVLFTIVSENKKKPIIAVSAKSTALYERTRDLKASQVIVSHTTAVNNATRNPSRMKSIKSSVHPKPHHLCSLRQQGQPLDTGVGVVLAPHSPALQQWMHRLSPAQAQEVNAFLQELQQHIVHSTVGVGGEQDALALRHQALDG